MTEKERSTYFNFHTPPVYRATGFIEDEDVINSYRVIVFGTFGTGKSYFAYKLAKTHYVKYLQEFEIATESGLLHKLKAGFKNGDYEEIFEKYKNIDFLVVDEMGKSNGSIFDKMELFEILNYRYEWEKRTLLVCNANTSEELSDILSPAVLDRYRENIIEMSGTSRRYK